MGFRLVELKLPPDYTVDDLKARIAKNLKLRTFSYTIDKQSLDARKKNDIHWILRVGVTSPALKGAQPPAREKLRIPQIPLTKSDKHVLVVGSGPAGLFAALTLARAGFKVTLAEQGRDISSRLKDIGNFEKSGDLDERSNYAFGEGGAGTFSDGKLTSRSKSISLERDYIFDTYMKAGAPAEIAYLAHPHLGSDNLRKISVKLRKFFESMDGDFRFGLRIVDIHAQDGKVQWVDTTDGRIEADYFVFATGHSDYETYRMLMRRGVPFRTKGFALGCRVEHRQEIINKAQWGSACLPGLKAAEYRVTFKHDDFLPVYSFCMCPGGKVVPAAVYKHTNIVNGMSLYRRDSDYANAAAVVGVRPELFLGDSAEPLAVLEWLEKLEASFYDFSGSFKAPACKISDFLEGKISPEPGESSYPLGLVPADPGSLLPPQIVPSLKEGLKHFGRKLKGFDSGVIMGLESKTSSPVQVLREPSGLCHGFENFYISGEGGGYAGGIVSSAADGIKGALDIIGKES